MGKFKIEVGQKYTNKYVKGIFIVVKIQGLYLWLKHETEEIPVKYHRGNIFSCFELIS